VSQGGPAGSNILAKPLMGNERVQVSTAQGYVFKLLQYHGIVSTFVARHPDHLLLHCFWQITPTWCLHVVTYDRDTTISKPLMIREGLTSLQTMLDDDFHNDHL
jgi:hypothetical protein